MIKSITHFLIIVFIFQQLQSQIYQIDQKKICDEIFQIYVTYDLYVCNLKLGVNILTGNNNYNSQYTIIFSVIHVWVICCTVIFQMILSMLLPKLSIFSIFHLILVNSLYSR